MKTCRARGFSPWREACGRPVAALPLLLVVDLGLGWQRFGHLLGTSGEWCLLWLHSAARGVLLSGLLSLLALFMLGLAAACRRVGWRRPDPLLALWWALFSAGFVWLTDPLTRGLMISQSSHVELLRWGLRLGGPLGLGAALLFGRWFLSWLREGGKRGRLLTLGALFWLAAVALGAANLRLFLHYPEFHTLLAAMLIVLVLGASRLITTRTPLDPASSPRALGLWWCLGAMSLGGGLWARGQPAFSRVRAAEDVLAPLLGEWRGFTSPLLSRLAPLPSPPALQSVKLLSPDENAIERALDKAVPGRRSMNVLWIAIDSLRHDRSGFTPLGPPGGPARHFQKHPVTPVLDGLAQEAFVFRRAYTTYPTSNYAYLSLLTGLYAGATPLKKRGPRGKDAASRQPVARVLAERGWFTLGVTSFGRHAANSPEWFGLLKPGFELYNPHQRERSAYASEVAATFLMEVARRPSRPFFAFVHFFGPHKPYGDAEDRIVFGGKAPSETDLYDSDTRHVDGWIGRIVAALKARGQWEHTLLMVFADHGESFGEHGARTHAGNLFEQQIHVPLLVRIPGLRGRVVDDLVSLADLLPTTLSFLGIKDPSRREGVDMLASMLGQGAENQRLAFSEVYWRRTGRASLDVRALISGPYKLIQVARPEPAYQLYDLLADPAESRNLFGSPSCASSQKRLLGLLRRVLREMQGFR